MAPVPALYALFCLIVLTQAVCASSHLPLLVSNFIPGCAEKCVLSFIDVNYEGTDCESQGSLRCFCGTEGNTGFTLGEGAVQCITAEKKFGTCSDYSADQNVIDSAYFMCDNQLGAIEPTHKVITASLLLPTTKGGVVSFPPLTKTKGQPNLPTSLPSTLVTATSASPKPPKRTSATKDKVTKTRPTSEATTGASTTRNTATGTDGAGALPPVETEKTGKGDDNNDGGSSSSLTKPQIAGVSVGVISAVALAIGAVFLARRCRRRRHPEVKTGFLPRRSTWGYNLTGESSTSVSSNSLMANGNHNISDIHNIPAPGVIPPPPAYGRSSYSRASWRPEAIGLALAPGNEREATAPAAPATSNRRISKLLPAKPVMPPLFAKRDSLPGPKLFRDSQPPQPQRMNDSPPRLPPLIGLSNPSRAPEDKPQPPVPLKLQIPTTNDNAAAVKANTSRTRESALTEFEEDDDVRSEGQIWRPPSATPFSATTPYYVADKNGNWVLSEMANKNAEVAELPASTPPIREPMSAPATGPQRPIVFPSSSRSVSGPHGPASQEVSSGRPSLAPAADIRRSQAAASSVYSQHSSVPYPLFYSGSDDQRGSGPPSQSVPRTSTSLDASRNSDITLFENSSDEPTPPEVLGNLSPVVESPASGNRRAHVAYPQIPRNSMAPGRPNQPPPRRPPMYYPPGQPSPTLGMMQGQGPPQQGTSSYNVPNKGRRPMEPPGLIRSGSPPTMRVVEPSPEPDDRGMLPSARASRPPSFQPPVAPQSRVQPSPYQHRPPYQYQQQQPYQQPYQQQPLRASYNSHHYPSPAFSQESQIPSPLNRPDPHRFPPHQPQYGSQRPPQQRPQQPPQQQYPRPAQQQQQAPSLDTLVLPPPPPASTTYNSPISEASTSSSLLAKRLGSDRAAQMALGEGGAASQSRWRREGAPTTPTQGGKPSVRGWMPKLTPTRRGDDLVLNVQ